VIDRFRKFNILLYSSSINILLSVFLMTSVEKQNWIDHFFSRFISKEEADQSNCTYKINLTALKKSIVIECRNCRKGNSSLDDPVCRQNIFGILIKEPKVDKIILSHLYERDYEGESISLLYLLAGFIDNLSVFKSSEIPAVCGNCLIKRRELIDNILKISIKDPVEAYMRLNGYIESKNYQCLNKTNNNNGDCNRAFIYMLTKMKDCANGLESQLSKDTSASLVYNQKIKPYTRPGFSTSRIYTEPPDNAIFLESYDVARSGGRTIEIVIYNLSDRPESLYFVFSL